MRFAFLFFLLSSGAFGGVKYMAPSGKSTEVRLQIQSDDACLEVRFNQSPGEAISCSEFLPLNYRQRNCGTRKTEEVGFVKAKISCLEEKRMKMAFRTQNDLIEATLISQAVIEGRSGWVNRYKVIKNE